MRVAVALPATARALAAPGKDILGTTASAPERTIPSDARARAVKSNPLKPEMLMRVHAYWRAANYLSVGQIYLYDNPLLQKPLTLAHVKPRLLGHWGTTPGLNFIYVHLNRVIKEHDLDAMASDAFQIRRLLDNNPRDLALADIRAIYDAAY